MYRKRGDALLLPKYLKKLKSVTKTCAYKTNWLVAILELFLNSDHARQL
jgi:hypothetical protein